MFEVGCFRFCAPKPTPAITLPLDKVGGDSRPSSSYRKWPCRVIVPACTPKGRLGMRRRDVMTMLAGATAYPLLASAQQKAMPVIGFLSAVSAEPHAPFVAASG